MSAEVSRRPDEVHSSSYQVMEVARKVGVYFLLLLASLIVLFPILFSLSLALQGSTLAPSLIPDFSKLDFSSFGQAFAQEPNLGRWIINSDDSMGSDGNPQLPYDCP
jgi:ABC-type glycerol-3-phosphate transport system permease component